MRKAVYLDRDGTINVDKGYVYKPEDFEFIDGVPEVIKCLNDLVYLVIVVSNQSGIARGFYTSGDVINPHKYIDNELLKYGAHIDAYYFCPHHPDFGIECNCRKPKTGMIEQAMKDFDINLNESWIVGDKNSDVECSSKVGIRGILITLNDNLNKFVYELK